MKKYSTNSTSLPPTPNKLLGQHYLTDKKIIEKICNDYAQKFDCIIEIGPGPATLTKHLSSISNKNNFLVIEKDPRFLEILKTTIDEKQIIIADALEVSIDDYCKKFSNDNNSPQKNIWLVSNLPYNISSPLIIRFLQSSAIKYMTLMMQKEVGEKIIGLKQVNIKSNKSNKQMSSLKALVQTFFSVKKLVDVPPGAFSPPPKVDSIVLSFEKIEKPEVSIDDFFSYEKFLRMIFSEKRKQIGTLLKRYLSELEFNEIIDVFKKFNLDITLRAETLDLIHVHALYAAYAKIKNKK